MNEDVICALLIIFFNHMEMWLFWKNISFTFNLLTIFNFGSEESRKSGYYIKFTQDLIEYILLYVLYAI